MPLELRLLRYFVAVAEELNFTRAADALYMAQPSLSAAIQTMEQQMGVKLFVRDTRHVELTAAGQAFLPHARNVLAGVEEGLRVARAAQAGTWAVLRVLYTTPLEPTALDALDRLEARDPAPPITARGVWAAELMRELQAGNADAGILRWPDDGPGVQFRELCGEPSCALVSEHHPLAGRTASVRELAGFPVVSWAPELGFDGYNRFVSALYGDGGVQPRLLTARRLDVSFWRPVVAEEAVAIVGLTERAPGGTSKVLLTDARPMPLVLGWRSSAPPALLDTLAEAITASAELLSSAACEGLAAPG